MLASGFTSASLDPLLITIERSARGLGVLIILGIFLWKRGPDWRHLLEMAVLLILGIWFLPSLVPAKVSSVMAQINTGGTAGPTGVSWGMLALLVGLVALVVFAFK